MGGPGSGRKKGSGGKGVTKYKSASSMAKGQATKKSNRDKRYAEFKKKQSESLRKAGIGVKRYNPGMD